MPERQAIHDPFLNPQFAVDPHSISTLKACAGLANHTEQAVTDSPCAIFADDLIQAYPEAKVILTVRDDSQAWKRSMEKTIISMVQHGKRKSFLDRVHSLYRSPSPFEEYGAKITRYTRLLDVMWDYRRIYDDHNAWVQRLVKQGDRLLIFNVKQGWGPLCEFLDTQVPLEEFPWVNDSDTFSRNVARFGERSRPQLLKRSAKAITAICVVAVAVRCIYFANGQAI